VLIEKRRVIKGGENGQAKAINLLLTCPDWQ